MTEYQTKTLEDYCDFQNESWVYIMMAIARSTDNNEINASNQPVFREIVKDERDIRRKCSKLSAIANGYEMDEGWNLDWRLYVSVNPKDVEKGHWQFMRSLTDWQEHLVNGDEGAIRRIKKIDRNWISKLQQKGCRARTYFLFDLDEAETADVVELRSDLSDHDTEIITTRGTPNGWHVITDSFNYTELETDVEYELKTDAMLFIDYL